GTTGGSWTERRTLGERCSKDAECQWRIEGSHCDRGHCRCLPYFAAYNRTHCLEATLLGEQCLVDEQCTLKVANSGCLHGLCGCTHGFLQFRRHTCLAEKQSTSLLTQLLDLHYNFLTNCSDLSELGGGKKTAKLGQICYEHAHCRLWQRNSHCDFLIPNLFGRCQCTAPMRRVNDVCRPDDLVRPPPLSHGNGDLSKETTINAATLSSRHDEQTGGGGGGGGGGQPAANEEQKHQQQNQEETGVAIEWLKNDSAQSTISSFSLNSINSESSNSLGTQNDRFLPTMDHDDDTDDAIVVEAVIEPQSVIGNHDDASTWTSESTSEAARRPSAVTLGHECVSDVECRLADPYSRCVEGICDCVSRGNGSSCSARNAGCPAGSFRCKSSGKCVSWFFVCDGRPDCSDGSDERCWNGAECPEQAFRCSNVSNAVCVSRAAICDGKQDCPHGEDEAGCNDRRKCPRGAFRCDNGQCLPAYEFCNAVVSCRDGSDEPRGACRRQIGSHRAVRLSSKYCPFRCDNGRCRSDAIVCSGRDGCGDGSDEKRCSVC
ncbi:unnamed protein product, partial [Heterotrigona itama]